MSVSLSDAVDDLLARKTQDSGRLNLLAQYCIESFANVGLPGVRGGKADEVGIRGLGRQKDWDLAYVLAGKRKRGPIAPGDRASRSPFSRLPDRITHIYTSIHLIRQPAICLSPN